MDQSNASSSQSQCLQFCGNVVNAYDDIAGRLSKYTTSVAHLPHGLVTLAHAVVGANCELSSIYSGLFDATLIRHVLPKDVITAIEKKLRGAEEHMHTVDQLVNKLLDREQHSSMGRLRRELGKMFSDNRIEKVTLGVIETRDSLKVGSLLLQQRLGTACTEIQRGHGCLSLAAALETATGQPLQLLRRAESPEFDDPTDHTGADTPNGRQHTGTEDRQYKSDIANSALDSIVSDIKALDLDSSTVFRMKSNPLDMPLRRPLTTVARDEPSNNAVLISAIRARDHKAVREVLARGGSPNTGTEMHALNIAISGRDSESVRLLLLYGASPNVLDQQNQSPLSVATGNSSLEVVITLLKYGANPNSAIGGKSLSLAIAVSAGNVQVTHVLLIYGADPNQKTNSGNTLLIDSINERSPRGLTEMLLKYGADPNQKSHEGKTALFEAITCGRADIVSDLIEHKADPNLPGPKHSLWPAVYYPECLRILLANGADHMKTPGIIELATGINNIESTRLLLKARVDPNGKKDGIYTALCTAIRDNRTDIFGLLLRSGADPNLPANEYPAFKCITHYREHFLPALVAAGAKLDAPKGIVEAAVAKKNSAALRWLLENGVDPNGRCLKGYTPLSTAIRERNIEFVDLLLAHGANPNIRGEDWPVCMAVWYPPILKRILSVLQEPRSFKGLMEMAVMANQLPSVKLLRAAGVSVEDRNGGVFSPLTTAIREHRIEIVAFLINEGGADVNAPGEHLPIVKALRRCHTDFPEIIDMLLDKGANPNKTYCGWNGIMQALENGDLDMLKRLISKAGVDLEIRDELGRTVTDIALSRGWDEAASILQSSNVRMS